MDLVDLGIIKKPIKMKNFVKKYWKWLWLASLVVFVVYFVKEYLESGFDSVLFASGIAILVSGVGFLNKK